MVNWRAHPYDADGVLFILKPQVVFRARVNLASATYPLAEIPYDNVTYGSISAVKMGMTVLVGSTEGSADRGRMYVRGDVNHQVEYPPGSNTLKIGYCSRGHQAGEVDLVDDSYITVLDLYEPWKRASRMLGQNGAVLKDYDLTPFPDLPPAAIMGGVGGMAQMDYVSPTTGKHQITDYDSSASYGTSGDNPTIASVAWTAPGGTFINGTNSGSFTPDLEFSAGARWVTLDANDTNGLRALPRVQLVVSLARSGGIPGFSAPVSRVSKAITRLTPEGVTFEVQLQEALDPDDFIAGVPVLWMTTERYAGVEGSVTGYKLKFAGWLDYERSFGQAYEYDFERSTTLYAIDTAQRAAQLRSFPSTMARESVPDHANKMLAATLDRYWWWYLVWHSSIPMLADCYWSGLDTPFRRFSSPGGSMYTVLDLLAKAFAYRTTMDSRGRLLMKPDPLRLDEADRTDTVLQSLLPGDIVRIDRLKRSRGRIGQMRANFTRTSSLNASDATAQESDYSVTAPGDVEGQGTGSQQSDHPWWAATTAQAQARVGHDYERLNAREERLRIMLAHGGDAGIEPALMQWVEVTTDENTLGWLADPLVAERCLVTAVEFVYDDEAGTQTQSIEVERETVGTPGRLDPLAGDSTPVPPDLGPIVTLRRGMKTIAAFDTAGHLWITNDFDTDAPAWTDYDLSATLGLVGMFIVDAFSPFYVGTGDVVNGWIAAENGMFRITDIFGATGSPRTLTQQSLHGAETVYPGLCRMQFERGVRNFGLATRVHLNPGGLDAYSWLVTTDGETWSLHEGLITDPTWLCVHVSPHTAGLAYIVGDPSGAPPPHGYRSTDYAASFASMSNPDIDGATEIHVPYQSTDDSIVYAAAPGYLVRIEGLTQTNIAPVKNTKTVAPVFQFGVKTCDIDLTHVAAACFETYVPADPTANAGQRGVFYSEDQGDTWQEVAINDPPGGVLPLPMGCAFPGDDAQTIYAWGGAWIGYTESPASGLSLKFSEIGAGLILNICGGPDP